MAIGKKSHGDHKLTRPFEVARRHMRITGWKGRLKTEATLESIHVHMDIDSIAVYMTMLDSRVPQ